MDSKSRVYLNLNHYKGIKVNSQTWEKQVKLYLNKSIPKT